MLNQLLSVMTPELIIHAIKANPTVIIQTLQKFDTFKLLGQSLNTEQQIVLSNNAPLINDFLKSEAGRTAAYLWAEEYCSFVSKWKEAAKTQAITGELDSEVAQKEAEIRAKLKAEIEAKVEARIRAEIEQENILEIERKVKSEIAAKAAKLSPVAEALLKTPA
jgi:hypothetical protein